MSDCATPKICFETPTALLQINILEASPPHLAICLEVFCHRLPLRLVFPEILEGLFFIWIIRRLKGTSCSSYAFCAKPQCEALRQHQYTYHDGEGYS
jgi:hypothetical protein